MSFTRIDCFFYRGESASIDTSCFAALNPSQKPGSLVAAGSSAARESIGGQVACKLALEHFTEGVLDYFDSKRSPLPGVAPVRQKRSEISLEVLESAFRRANSSVYEFGHKLAAGGRMAASLLGIVIEDNIIAVGRVGHGGAYLFRGGELYPFFEADSDLSGDRGRGSYIGSNSLVAVELASVPIQESDIIVMFSTFLDQEREQDLVGFLGNCDLKEGNPCADLTRYLFPDLLDLSFSLIAKVGPDTVYLATPVTEAAPANSLGKLVNS